jgi:hypothetical protein
MARIILTPDDEAHIEDLVREFSPANDPIMNDFRSQLSGEQWGTLVSGVEKHVRYLARFGLCLRALGDAVAEDPTAVDSGDQIARGSMTPSVCRGRNGAL